MIDLLPRDLQEYFDSPKMTSFTGMTATPIQVLKANPDRIGIIFSRVGTGVITIGLSNQVSVAVGYALANAGDSLLLTHEQWGNLVQSEWWAQANTTSSLTVFETFLPRSPLER